MPKMKTKSGAKKRFRVTGSGKVKFKAAKTSHMMMNKPTKMKRKARGMQIMAHMDAYKILENFLPALRGRKKNKKPVSASTTTDKAA